MKDDNIDRLIVALGGLDDAKSADLIAMTGRLLGLLEEDASSDTDMALRGRLTAFVVGYRLGLGSQHRTNE